MNRLYNFHSRSDLATYRYTFFFNFAVCLANNKLYLIIPLYLHYLRKLGNMDMLIAFVKIWENSEVQFLERLIGCWLLKRPLANISCMFRKMERKWQKTKFSGSM